MALLGENLVEEWWRFRHEKSAKRAGDLARYADKHPEAKAALAELARQVRHPFDPTKSDR